MRWLIILLAIFTLQCSTVDNHNKSKPTSLPQSDLDSIQAKYDVYLNLLPTQQDKDGFLTFDYCDSLLFSGLLAGLTSVDILAARDSNGAWYRKPLEAGSCYDGTPGSSTLSRDMLVGLLWYIWTEKRLDIADDLFNYGVNHNWIMGQGDISRTYMVPGLQATLAEIIYHLGGANHLAYRSIPQVYTPNKGFEAHLDALSALLRAEVLGEMDAQAFSLMKAYYDTNVNNALFSYVYHRYGDGDQTSTVKSLLNEQWFPSDRLPTSSDRCEGYLWQRDFGSDWEPCEGNTTHSGLDFLFVAHVLIK